MNPRYALATLLLATLVLAALTTLSARADGSCSCGSTDDAATMVDFNDWIGVAEVVSSETLLIPRPDGGTWRHWLYTLRVKHTLKGRLAHPQVIQVETGSSWGCGYGMSVGSTHFIGAVRRTHGYFTSVCNGNAWLDAEPSEYFDPMAWMEAVETELDARGSRRGCGFGSPFGMLQSITLLGLGAAFMRRRQTDARGRGAVTS